MIDAFATPQIYLTGRILNAIGFDTDGLYLKYKIIIGTNYNLIDGVLSGQTFVSELNEEDNINVIYFDQPLYFNLACRSVKGWPKILVEVFSNDSDGKSCLAGYGIGYFPVNPGYNRMTINCWRPTKDVGSSLEENLLGNTSEFVDKSAVYTITEKFGVNSVSTGQINIECEIILKDFILHGIKI